MKVRTIAVAVATAFALTTTAVPPAMAADDLTTLAKMAPGVSKPKLKAAVKYLAKKRKTTYTKELKAVIAAIRKQGSINSSHKVTANAASTDVAPAGGGSGSKIYAANARWVGDIVVSTLGFRLGTVNYGHTGLYVTTGRILHAPGAGKDAVRQDAKTVEIGVGTQYMTTPLSVEKQQKVAEYAVDISEGQAYNYLFFSNKVPDDTYYTDPVKKVKVNLNPGDRVNCSELVWASYKAKGGLDLDGYTKGNGDAYAVFPWDIEQSADTTSYTP